MTTTKKRGLQLRIMRLYVITFILILAITVIPAKAGQTFIDDDISLDMETDQLPSGIPETLNINASVTNVDRNITVTLDGRLELLDEITLKIYGENTQVSVVNYTLPSFYADNINSIKFFSRFDDRVGLGSGSTEKDFAVFRGQDATTFMISIGQNGTLANSTLKAVNLLVRADSLNVLDVDLSSSTQRATFMSPLIPMFQNLAVDNALIGITLSGSLDGFDLSETGKIDNKRGAKMPIFNSDRSVASYENMSRDPYVLFSGLQDGDYDSYTYQSDPVGTDEDPVSSTTVPFVISEANRDVRIDPWGKVFITEEIEILHLGAKWNRTSATFVNPHQVPGLFFTISDEALITDVYDEFGRLDMEDPKRNEQGYPASISKSNDGLKQSLEITFRNPIYGGETYRLGIEYEFNSSNVISITDNRNFVLNTTLFSDYNTSIYDLTVNYQFPPGSRLISQGFAPRSNFIDVNITTSVNRNSLSSFRHLELTIQATNATSVDNYAFQIVYKYNGLGHISYLATYLVSVVILMLLLFAATNIQYSSSKAVEIEKQQFPVEEMDNFFNVFSEKAGAEKRLADLRNRRRKGKISKKDFDGKVKAIRRRLREITPQLESAAQKLSVKGGRYENYVTKVMLASQRQIDIRRNSRTTKKSYEMGEIPKNIYQMRVREFNQDLAKQEEAVNKTLAEMVELIQKFNQ